MEVDHILGVFDDGRNIGSKKVLMSSDAYHQRVAVPRADHLPAVIFDGAERICAL